MPAQIISIANQKGGVGKTTTAQNLGCALAQYHHKRVLLIDLDPQGNLSDSFGITDFQYSIMSALDETCKLHEVIQQVSDNLFLAPANVELATAEILFVAKMGRENLLKKQISDIINEYDYIFIDCSPSLGLLTVNAFTASDYILVPVQAEYHSLTGLKLIFDSMTQVKENINENLELLGLIITFFDNRKTLNKDVKTELKNQFPELIFNTYIRDNISLAEAPSQSQSIFDYRCRSYGSDDYKALADEFINRMEITHASGK